MRTKRYDRNACECVVWTDTDVLVILEGEPFVKSNDGYWCKCKEAQSTPYHYLALPLSTSTKKDWSRHHGWYCTKCLGFTQTG